MICYFWTKDELHIKLRKYTYLYLVVREVQGKAQNVTTNATCTWVAEERAEGTGREVGAEPAAPGPCVQLCSDSFHSFTYYSETISVKLVIISIL